MNQRSYAEVDGIPVSLLGIAGYALLLVLTLLGRRVLTAYFAGMGLAYGLYLTNIEAHILDAWCVYCVASLILSAILSFLALADLIFGRTPVTRS